MTPEVQEPETMLAEVLSSEYLMNCALQDAGFFESRVRLALNALFGPDPDAPDPDIFEALDPTLDPDAFEPSERDWADYRAWAEEVDARWWAEQIAVDELAEAHARADVAEAIEDSLRYTDEDLRAAGLAVG
jgi:hypothetical protein